MITLYLTPSCTSCRKARSWLEENNIPYKERNLYTQPLTMEEIKQILRLTERGTEEIISTRSKAFQELNMGVEELPLQQLYEIIKKQPGILHRPILTDGRRLQIGYNYDDIRSFIPRSIRTMELNQLLEVANI